MADSLNEATKYVATHRPDSLGWGPVEDLGPDIVEGVRRADDWPPVSRSLPQRDCTRYRPALPLRVIVGEAQWRAESQTGRMAILGWESQKQWPGDADHSVKRADP